jgi:outer membrane protein TolC
LSAGASILVFLVYASGALAQPPRPNAPEAAGRTAGAASPSGSAASAQPEPPVTLTLTDALRRARDYSQQFVQAGIAAELAREDRVQAKAALFPTAGVFNQYIYTQGNGTPSGVFVANDGVHVYSEQATVHAELFPMTRRADYQRAVAAEAAARARQDIAARGLVATVVQNYYGLVTAQRHEGNAESSLQEARQFLVITQKQERGGEAARADVVKAELQYQQRQRDLTDARANTQKARIALGVMLFPNLRQAFDITDDLRPDLPLPPFEQVRSLALSNSPEVRAAEAGLRQSEAGIRSARSAYYPTLMLDYFFGINANVLAIRGPENRQNLGSVVQGTVNIPIWNWGATRSRVRQAELLRKQAQFDATFARRMLESNLNAFYLEAEAARAQLESLHRSLNLAEESLRLTVLRYEAGEATALEVADAQTTLAQARNASADGLVRYRVALAALQTLTGQF